MVAVQHSSTSWTRLSYLLLPSLYTPTYHQHLCFKLFSCVLLRQRHMQPLTLAAATGKGFCYRQTRPMTQSCQCVACEQRVMQHAGAMARQSCILHERAMPYGTWYVRCTVFRPDSCTCTALVWHMHACSAAMIVLTRVWYTLYACNSSAPPKACV